MTKMLEEEYLHDRVENQIAWYSDKSLWNQRCFTAIRAVELVLAGLIPILASEIEYNNDILKVIVAGMGLCIAVLTGLVALFKFQERWIEYRTTAESLKHEKYLFLTNSEPYDEEGRFHLFVRRVESLISKENSTWVRSVTKNAKEE